MKQKLIPIISIAIGLLAFALSSLYLENKRGEIEEAKEKIYGKKILRVIVASHDLPGGTVITTDDLGVKTVREREATLLGKTVRESEADMLLGRETIFRLDEGEMIHWSNIKGGTEGAVALAPMIKPGLRAISLAVGGAPALSGMLRPSDRVDILGTFGFPSGEVRGEMETVTLTVLQDVTVMAVGKTLAKQRPGRRFSGGGGTVTVSVTPREAELLVFAQQVQGSLTLALRNPSDNSFEPKLPIVNFEHLQNKIEEYNLHRQRYIRHKRNL
ncbi:MAG: Flp pilus assembly protein CpaB [Kiritimatiellia bacterium]